MESIDKVLAIHAATSWLCRFPWIEKVIRQRCENRIVT
jgi:hypothetical protein